MLHIFPYPPLPKSPHALRVKSLPLGFDLLFNMKSIFLYKKEYSSSSFEFYIFNEKNLLSAKRKRLIDVYVAKYGTEISTCVNVQKFSTVCSNK